MMKKWLFTIGLALLLAGAISPLAQAGVSLRLNYGAPAKRFYTSQPGFRQPRLFASDPTIGARPDMVQRPLRIPGRWQWTPWGWYWAGGALIQ